MIEFLVLFISCSGTSSITAYSKSSLSDWVNSLPTTVYQRSEKNKSLIGFMYAHWSIYAGKWAQTTKKVKLSLFYSKGHLIHSTQFSVCIHYQHNTSHCFFCLLFFFLFESLTFIICEWRYDAVQQWALCVFSVGNVCERLACCRMGGNTDRTLCILCGHAEKKRH